jgi:hypothetical protein
LKGEAAVKKRLVKGIGIVIGILCLTCLALCGCSSSGSGDDGGGNGGNNPESGPAYITSIDDAGITTGYYETIDVAGDGSIYLLAATGLGTTASIDVYNGSYDDMGTFQDDAGDITASDIIVDAFGRIHIYYAWGDMIHKIYEADGNLVSEFSGDISEFLFAVAQDAEQSHYLIPFSGTGGGDGRSLYVRKCSHDFSTDIDGLEKSDLLQMLPGPPDQNDVTMNDIRVSSNNLIFICIDLEDANDGVLVLDEAFQKVAYLGGNWLLNFPRAVDFDASGNVYVSSTSGNKVLVFNDQLKKIGSIGESDFPDGLIQEEFLPGDIRVKNGKIYILDPRNDSIHIFTTMD